MQLTPQTCVSSPGCRQRPNWSLKAQRTAEKASLALVTLPPDSRSMASSLRGVKVRAQQGF
jgi:hypothetical protein